MTFSAQYTVTTEPAPNDVAFGLPLDFLRQDSGVDDEAIEELLNAAVAWAESWTNRVLRQTVFTAQFPCAAYREGGGLHRPFVEIRKSPLVSVQALRYLPAGEAVFSAVTPTIERRATYSRVFFPRDFADEFETDTDFPIEVDFTAGFTKGVVQAGQIQLPPSVSVGLKQHITFMYENRGDVKGDYDDAVPDEVKRSYMPIRIPVTAL